MKCNLNDQSKRIPIDRNRREIGESARKSRGGEEEREGGGRMARPSLLEDVGGEVELKFDRFPSLLSISFENFPPLSPFLILRFFFFFENKIKLDVEV